MLYADGVGVQGAPYTAPAAQRRTSRVDGDVKRAAPRNTSVPVAALVSAASATLICARRRRMRSMTPAKSPARSFALCNSACSRGCNGNEKRPFSLCRKHP